MARGKESLAFSFSFFPSAYNAQGTSHPLFGHLAGRLHSNTASVTSPIITLFCSVAVTFHIFAGHLAPCPAII